MTIDSESFQEHRIIWLLVHGVPCKNIIDHIDFNRQNNRIENLRECTSSQNSQHRTARNGRKGVTVHKQTGKFQAQIEINGHNHYLGLFTTPHEAAVAYDNAAIKQFGKFAVTNEALP